MKKLVLFMLSLILCFLVACGNITSTSSDNSSDASATSVPADNSSQKPFSDNADSSVPTATPSIQTMTSDEGYADPEREISILGLKEYRKIKTKTYTDKAKKGKKFLVLYIKFRNRSYSDEYINVNYWTTKLDGKKIENTYLVNQPKNYPTLFKNIPSETDSAGYVVWEVPENWKKLQIAYEGWKDTDHVILRMTLTPKDIKNPPDFEDLN